ncbi:EcsC family protein [Scopulibacillus cellulosilyticus]|uniref:EcsC family protein n=1 Tax=Scopulibacillus cellulosilyticus TaxID=2665665 RepID=A0ABW2PX78_9BACL
MDYEQLARKECFDWQKKMMKRSSAFSRAANSVQKKINDKIPQKVHDVITKSVKGVVKTVMFGSEITTKQSPIKEMSLYKREELVKQIITNYKRLATIEGAGTGAGGLWWGLADFPMLLTLKIKFLYEVASIYGFDVKDYRERLYVLHVFQVAFSNDKKRMAAFLKLKNWPETVSHYSTIEELDWQEFQQDYRDYIDLVKLLQIIPGFGAIVGAVGNYRFLNELGKTAMNAYRMRLFDLD